MSFSSARAVAALMGTTVLGGSMTASLADSVAKAPMRLAQTTAPQAAVPKNQVAAGAAETKGETVEQRITELHSALTITSDEDAQWNAVAQAMRENATAMDKLIAESHPAAELTAIDDLKR